MTEHRFVTMTIVIFDTSSGPPGKYREGKQSVAVSDIRVIRKLPGYKDDMEIDKSRVRKDLELERNDGRELFIVHTFSGNSHLILTNESKIRQKLPGVEI
jgi:hypothetical protein